MLVEQIFINNPLANFNYLVACPDTGAALALDPLDPERLHTLAKARGWRIEAIVNTHAHWDHTEGNLALKALTGAQVYAHAQAKDSIPGFDQGLKGGDILPMGGLQFNILDTPGHTATHLCLFQGGERPALFSGDTLFNAGAGNCGNGGDPGTLYESFAAHIAPLMDDVLLYPGHDYAARNLAFTLSIEADNRDAQSLLEEVEALNAKGQHLLSTLGTERKVNAFLRLNERGVTQGLEARELNHPLETAKGRFIALRGLSFRNRDRS